MLGARVQERDHPGAWRAVRIVVWNADDAERDDERGSLIVRNYSSRF